MRKLFAFVLVMMATSTALTDSLDSQILGVTPWMPYLDPLEPVYSAPGRVKVSQTTLADAGIVLGHKVSLNNAHTAVVASPFDSVPTPYVTEFGKTALGCAVDLVNFLRAKTPAGQEFQPITLDAEHLFSTAGTQLEILKVEPVVPRDWRMALQSSRDYDVRWFLATRQAQKEITFEDTPTSFVVTPLDGKMCAQAYQILWPEPVIRESPTQFTDAEINTPRQ